MADVSWGTLSFIQERLLNPATGFNYWIGQVAASGEYPASSLEAAGVTSGGQAFQLNQGGNLFLGDFSIDDLYSAGCRSYPLLAIFSAKGRNQELITPDQYAGVVLSVIKIVIAWGGATTPADVESPKAAILNALVTTFNSEQYYGLLNGTGISYNNEITYDFDAPVKKEGAPWRVTAYVTLTHRVVTSA